MYKLSTDPPVEYSPDEKRLMDLLSKVKDIPCFEYEGVKYLGYHVEAVKEFCENTTYPADFHVWLQNNYKQIIE
jgi:hypothetical protein